MNFLQRFLLCIFFFPVVSLAFAAADPLVEGFENPPPEARPFCFWAWMNGNVTKEGITADLEGMKRIGVGGVYLFPSLTVGIPAGPVEFMSPEWKGLVGHTAREAARLGIEVHMHNGAGWSATGGPWNTVEDSMQMLTSSETVVTGSARFSEALPRPQAQRNSYRDIALVAVPVVLGESVKPAVSSGNVQDIGNVSDGDWSTLATFPLPSAEVPQVIDLTFEEPFEAHSVNLVTGPGRNGHSGEIQVSEDGVNFRTLRAFRIFEFGGNKIRHIYGFEPVRARHFRVVFNRGGPKAQRMTLAEIGLYADERIDDFAAKGGFAMGASGFDSSTDATPSPIQASDVVDLTDKMVDGILTWDVPPGSWKIIRFGHTTTEGKNHPSPPAGTGLESDKLSKSATRKHWDAMMGTVLNAAGDAAGKAGIVGGFTDSWEVGYQNCTPGFFEEFRKRRGYDPTPWLPALCGRVIGSPVLSERFLWDWRRTVSDLFADNFFGENRALANARGILYTGEPYGTNFDNLQCGGRMEYSIGEAWFGRPEAHLYTVKMAASTAHVYGKPFVGCEIFTCRDDFGSWQNHPFQLKAFGDLKMTEGINRFIIHASAHQPSLDRFPIMTYGECGIHFDRSNTWWEEAVAWVDYMRRAQFMLQAGHFTGDVLWFVGEETPTRLSAAAMNPPLPPGHDFSQVDAEALLTGAEVKDGRIVFPGGSSYRYLLLGEPRIMTLALARKLRGMVEAGATVIGRPPLHPAGLAGYPDSDQEMTKIVGTLWGEAPGDSGQRTVGKGRVIWGRTFEEIFAADKLAPDFEAKGGADLKYIHRTAGGDDIFFVAHGKETPAQSLCTFRVSGKTPQFWHPDTGAIEPCPVFREVDGRTEIPIRFDPAGSVFVVFRDKPPGPHLVSAGGENADAFRLVADNAGKPEVLAFAPCAVKAANSDGKTATVSVPTVPEAITLKGPWQVAFEAGRGAPASAVFDRLTLWNEHPDAGIKFFSGHAVYSTAFDLPQAPAKDERLFLDLGAVHVMAAVKLNGKDLGILWKPPFRLDVTSAVRPGRNDLEVRVVNLWINRMVGDARFPEDFTVLARPRVLTEWPDWYIEGKPRPQQNRVTFVTHVPFTKDSPLVPSGLGGPVRLIPAVVRPIL